MSQDPAVRTIPLFDPQSEFAKRALGALIAELSGAKKELPLAAVDIQAKVADRIGDVTVKQKFRNTFADHLEAVYIFPLAHSAVVTSFELRVGNRIVKGEVKERQQARQDYRQALSNGKRTALMEQERDDIFTMQVGNIPPGEEVSVEVKYSERLPFFEDGSCEIRLPLVVAPRYISGQAKDGPAVGLGTEVDTDEVPDASRITPPRLVDGAKDNVQLSVSVQLLQAAEGTFNIKDLSSSQHVVSTNLCDGSIKVELSNEEEPMNRDFILKWVAAEKSLKPNLISYTDDKGNTYCMLTVMSPKQDKFLGVPRDVIFIVDRSGSMGGPKMASAAKSCSILLDTLGPRDRFAICAFDTVNEWMHPHKEWTSKVDGRFVSADESGIECGKAYLRTIDARGGTELEPALAESLGEFKKRTNTDATGIIVVLTDGQVGNEAGVFRRLQTELGDARLFTVGIDTAVNGGILSRMATLGGGTATLVTPGAKLEKALSQIGREIGVPVLTGLKLEATHGNLESETVSPANLPDLFRGRAATIFFKMSQGVLTGKGKKKIRIKGTRQDGSSYVEEVTEKSVKLPAVASLYAKSMIRDLEDAYREESGDRKKISKRMIELSVAHSVLCRFTAFIAVDHAEVVNKDGTRRTVVQPVHQPAAWEQTDAAGTGQYLACRSLNVMGQLVRQKQSATGSYGAPPPQPAAPGAFGAPAAAPSPQPSQTPQSNAWGLSRPAADYESLDSLNEPTWGMAPPGGAWGSPAGGDQGLTLAESIKRKIGEGSYGAQPPSSNLGTSGRQAQSYSSPSSPSELVDAIKEMLRRFGQVMAQFATGANIDWQPLEDARALCLKHLQASKFAASAPKLQQFLRTEAVETIAAIKAGGLSIEIVDRLKDAIPELNNELTAIANDKTPAAAGGGNFWENSV